MGLFNLFRKLLGKKEPSNPLEALNRQRQEERPRCHHYTFAHMALRQVAFDDPINCVGALASPHSTEFLCQLWASVDSHCRERGETSTINPRELMVHPIRINDYPCAVVEMPEPWFITGCFYVVLVLKVIPEELEDLDDHQDAELLYYTLERGASMEGELRTVLCAWTKEGAHCNFGDGPEPTLDALADHLEEVLSSSSG